MEHPLQQGFIKSKKIPFCAYKIPFCAHKILFCAHKAVLAFDLICFLCSMPRKCAFYLINTICWKPKSYKTWVGKPNYICQLKLWSSSSSASMLHALATQEAQSQAPALPTNLPSGPRNPKPPPSPDFFLPPVPGKAMRAEARKEIKYILSAGPFVQK